MGDIHEREVEVEKEGVFGGSSPSKMGNIVWTYVKDIDIGVKEEYKDIGLCGFDYNCFEEDQGGGVSRWHRWVSIFEASK